MKRTVIFSIAVATCALLAASAATAQTRRGLPVLRTAEDPIPGLRGFGVVLVQGDMQAGQPTGDVPAAALKALSDLKDFLPYKSYKLLDTQWTMGSGRLNGRLQGPGNTGYEFELHTRRGEDVPLVVSKFVLRADHSEGFGIRSSDSAHRAQVASPEAKVFANLGFLRNLIDTSFSMDLGETVVVGTSRLQGNTALIVLLTAVSKTAATK